MTDRITSHESIRTTTRAGRTFALAAVASACLLPRFALGQQAVLARRGFDPSAVAVGSAVSAETALAAPQRERSRTGRIILQFLASSAGAAGTGLVAYFVFEDVGTRRVKGDAGYTRPANVAYLTGSWAGATLGAHLVGTSMGGRSPWWATATGALVGTLPLFAFGGVDEPYLPIFGVVLGWIPQAAFATIGFEAAGSRAR